MSLILNTAVLAILIWLILKVVFLEIPNFPAVMGMRKIHGPPGLPFFIGLVGDFMRLTSDGILDYIADLVEKYPRLCGMYLAGVPCVIVQKPQDIKHVLSSNRNISKGIEYNPILPWLNQGLLTSTGSKWQQRRKMLTPTFHFKILEDALTGMSHNTDFLANKLTETKGRAVVVDDYITRCTLDIIAETAMGVQLESQADKGKEYLDCVKQAAEMIVQRILSVYQLKDIVYALTINGWKFKSQLNKLHSFTDKVIYEKKKGIDNNRNAEEDVFGRKERRAFLDSLLDMQASNPESFTDKDIREEVDTFMFEGHDTTSTALCFGLWLLGNHPDIQEKLYEEIMETVGDGEMTMKALNSMTYLEKIIKETLRLYPSVPYISRRIVEDIVLDDGVIIPKTCNVILVPYIIHRDPEYFPDPEKFDPERFTEENSKGRHPFAYIPFSAGPRNCVGQKFAMLEMKTTIASVVRRVKIVSVTRREEFKILPHLIIRPTSPIKCKFIPRTKSY